MKRLVCTLLLLLFAASPAFSYDTGYFTTDYQDGRWWLIDPDGERFFSSGVNVVTPGAYAVPGFPIAPYKKNILDKYGSLDVWADLVEQRLEAWGFTTIGAWSDLGRFGHLPHTVNMNMSPFDWVNGAYPDYFSDDFYDRVDSEVASHVVPNVEDHNLIGYFTDNELRWGIDWRGFDDMFAGYFAFPSNAPGKIALVEWVEDRYAGDVAAFNAVWDMGITAFADLYSTTTIAAVTFDDDMAADREAFAGYVAEHYFATVHDAIRAVDTNHLILGCRFVSWVTPVQVAEAATAYVDVVSINHYLPYPVFIDLITWVAPRVGIMQTTDMLADYYDLIGKPIVISEFSVRGMDSGLPNTWPPNFFFETVWTQEERSDWFFDYATTAINTGYIVGYHWFAYMDEPKEGRFDGENSNFGLVDNWDEPWFTLCMRMSQVNSLALSWPTPW
jgi:hypothetical protein